MKSLFNIIIVGLLVISCSKDEGQFPGDNDQIRLSAYSVHLLAGGECSVDVLTTTKNLGLMDENPEIASGWWTNNGKSILIKGEGVGATVIKIQDRYNPSKKVEIKVFSDYFGGNYKIDEDQVTVIVQASNLSVQKVIIKELQDAIQRRYGTLYRFDKVHKQVIIENKNGTQNTGSYEWDIYSLSININGETDKFDFSVDDKGAIAMGMDMLRQYRLEYPSTDIYSARINWWLQPLNK